MSVSRNAILLKVEREIRKERNRVLAGRYGMYMSLHCNGLKAAEELVADMRKKLPVRHRVGA